MELYAFLLAEDEGPIEYCYKVQKTSDQRSLLPFGLVIPKVWQGYE